MLSSWPPYYEPIAAEIQQQFEAQYASSLEAVYAIDWRLANTIVAHNESFAALLSYEAGELVGKLFNDIKWLVRNKDICVDEYHTD